MPNDPPSDTADDTLADQDGPDERETQTDLEYQAAAALAATRREPQDTEPNPFASPGDTELTDELDLHTFQPAECADLVEEYVRAAREAGMTAVRIVHGKGVGTLRRIVHGVLEKHPDVASFKLADERSGSWGATLVELRPR